MSLTEQGVAWVPRGLDTLDWFYKRMTTGGAAEAVFFGAVAKSMSMLPSEYFQQARLGRRELPAAERGAADPARSASTASCGATTTRTAKAPTRTPPRACGPRSPGSRPTTCSRWSASTRPQFYGFDFDALREIGDRIGPRVEDVAQPISREQYPSDSTCNAFEREPALKAW